MKKENFIKKNYVFLIIMFLLIISSGLLICYVFSKINDNCNKMFGEFFYYCSIGTSTISLCLIPLYLHVRDEQREQKEREESEITNSIKEINFVTDIVNTPSFKFVSSVISKFNNHFGLNELADKFHTFQSNESYCDEVMEIIKNFRDDRNKPKKSLYHQVIEQAVIDSFYLCECKASKINSASKKVEFFYYELVKIVNFFESSALNVLYANINIGIYLREVFEIVDGFYRHAYYILFQSYLNDGLEQLDVLCASMYKEKEKMDTERIKQNEITR